MQRLQTLNQINAKDNSVFETKSNLHITIHTYRCHYTNKQLEESCVRGHHQSSNVPTVDNVVGKPTMMERKHENDDEDIGNDCQCARDEVSS